MLPRLFNNLKCSAVDTLKEYRVHYPLVQVIQTSTEVAWHLFKKMCEDAATVFERQAGREDGFGEGVELTRKATQLHLLSPDDLDGLHDCRILVTW